MDRTQEPLFLPRSPLVFVLGQVKIDPILSVANFIPEIQENVRKKGFTKLRMRELANRIVRDDGEVLRAEVKHQWEFHDVANRTSIQVDQDAIAVQTTGYDRYEEFEKIIRLALETCGEIMQISQVNRCGLRYIDIVEPGNGGDYAAFRRYIKPELLGLEGDEKMTRLSTNSQTELVTGERSRLRLRCLTLPKGIVLPPELLPCHLAFHKSPRRDRPFAMVDLDHYSVASFDFEVDATLTQLSLLHDALDIAFRASVTEEAIKEWKQPPKTQA